MSASFKALRTPSSSESESAVISVTVDNVFALASMSSELCSRSSFLRFSALSKQFWRQSDRLPQRLQIRFLSLH
ncbi:hypothetical protein ACHAXS_005033 [Conticribra weissflogii]